MVIKPSILMVDTIVFVRDMDWHGLQARGQQGIQFQYKYCNHVSMKFNAIGASVPRWQNAALIQGMLPSKLADSPFFVERNSD